MVSHKFQWIENAAVVHFMFLFWINFLCGVALYVGNSLSTKIYCTNLLIRYIISGHAYELKELFALFSIFSQVRSLNLLNLGGSAEELSETESLPSTARPATSRSQSRAAGPTRAIARTQQSERVRANVNRHRITQARTSQVWHEAWRFSLGLFSNCLSTAYEQSWILQKCLDVPQSVLIRFSDDMYD